MGQACTSEANLEPGDHGLIVEPADVGRRGAARVKLQVPAILEYRDLACRAVSSVCKDAFASLCPKADSGLLGQFINELMSAVGEAFNNAVIHAYRESHVADTVDMEFFWHGDRVTVQVKDTGASFELESVPELDLDMPHESGMGIHIIRCFVDDVSYQSGPPNILTLSKRIPGGAVVGPSDLSR